MMYVYAVLYQLFSGPYLGLGATSLMEHVPKSQVATAYGLYSFSCVPGFIFGAPMAGKKSDRIMQESIIKGILFGSN